MRAFGLLFVPRMQKISTIARLSISPRWESIIAELKLDRAAHFVGLRQRWEVAQVQMITLDGIDIGWLQSMTQGDALLLGQLFVAAGFQRRGIGTEVMNRLIEEGRVGSRRGSGFE
jgi:GNAT superfamily N-acetyltransferase